MRQSIWWRTVTYLTLYTRKNSSRTTSATPGFVTKSAVGNDGCWAVAMARSWGGGVGCSRTLARWRPACDDGVSDNGTKAATTTATPPTSSCPALLSFPKLQPPFSALVSLYCSRFFPSRHSPQPLNLNPISSNLTSLSTRKLSLTPSSFLSSP